MSWVTDVLLILGLREGLDEDFEAAAEIPGVKAINAWLHDRDFGALDRLDEHILSGGKAMQALVYGGAFNHLARSLDEFVQIIEGQPWRVPDEVQLLLKHEEEARFALYEIADGELKRRG